MKKQMSILTIILFFAASVFAAENLEKILPVIEEPTVILGGDSGVISTIAQNLKPLNPILYKNKEVLFTLVDGTKVGGLYFPRKNSNRLLIGTFGFLSDRWSTPVAQFVEEYIHKNRVQANVLILDHPTSAPFFVANGNISPGGYDEARMIIEITEQMLETQNYESIHLIGISMGGNSVINIMREASRRNLNYYKSGVSFSGVLDLDEVPRKQLAYFDSKNYWGQREASFKEGLGLFYLFQHFKSTVRYLTGKSFKMPYADIGEFFYKEYSERIAFLHSQKNKENWDSKVDTSTLNRFLKFNIIKNFSNEIQRPIYIVNSKDDPVVPYNQFQKLEPYTQENPYITPLGYKNGGHWGFTWSHGPELIKKILNNLFSI